MGRLSACRHTLLLDFPPQVLLQRPSVLVTILELCINSEASACGGESASQPAIGYEVQQLALDTLGFLAERSEVV